MNDAQSASLAESSEPGDNALAAAVLAGDTTMFGVLVTRHTHRIYGLALRLLGNSEEAEDATQEAFLRAYAHLASFRGSASFASWLYRIMLNVCRDQLRRRQAHERTVELSHIDQLWSDEHYTVDPERVVLALENRQVIEQALHHLPAKYRATLLLHEVDGLTLTEIADILDTPLPTVKSRLQRARMALVTLLDEAAHLEHASDEQGTPSPRRGSRKKGG
ncbi:MAG TPA: sigma-70 family RNA polymerase sigma factor [Ktedonobacteraceae bacterium]|jgi:RNA polymerase sigma-70 factor (ECF subfamily)